MLLLCSTKANDTYIIILNFPAIYIIWRELEKYAFCILCFHFIVYTHMLYYQNVNLKETKLYMHNLDEDHPSNNIYLTFYLEKHIAKH